MKIAVCVKHVPAGRLQLQPGTNRIDRNGPGELNDVDRNAVEEALRFKSSADPGADHEVVVVSVGPEEAVESLRTALALGADRAILVSDHAASGSDLIATSKLLAAALERESADLVLFGQQSSDGGGALLWAAVAERLHLPSVSQVTELTVDGATVRVSRETELGDDVIEADLPVLVAVSDAINEPRYTSLKGMMGAKRKPLDILSLAELGLSVTEAGEAGSRTVVLAISDPPTRANSIRVEDDGGAAQVIHDFLVERQLV